MLQKIGILIILVEVLESETRSIRYAYIHIYIYTLITIKNQEKSLLSQVHFYNIKLYQKDIYLDFNRSVCIPFICYSGPIRSICSANVALS